MTNLNNHNQAQLQDLQLDAVVGGALPDNVEAEIQAEEEFYKRHGIAGTPSDDYGYINL